MKCTNNNGVCIKMNHSSQIKVLKRRLVWTLAILFCYVLGSTIPLPFVKITGMYRSLLNYTPIGMMSFLGGANFQRLSVFSVGLNPFMISMLVVQLLTMARLFWVDTLSMQQMMALQQWIALILAIIQSLAVTLTFHLTANAWQATAVIVVLTAGSMFVLWLGVMNMQYGIGGTMTLILFNIIVGSIQPLIKSLKSLMKMNYGILWLVFLVAFALLSIVFWVAFNHAYYKMSLIEVSLDSTVKPLTMPIALNGGGMMTYMMGMALMTLPLILSQLFDFKFALRNWRVQTVMCFCISVFLFYFFSFMQLNPKEQAKSLRNRNAYILNVRPGKPTARFISKRLWFLCLPGAVLNAFQLTLGVVGSLYMGKYTAFALVPMDIVMVVMFMNGIKDQSMVLLIPRRYERMMKKEE